MKNLIIIIEILAVVVIANASICSQSVGDYMSSADGNWSAAATWVVWNGSTWDPATNPPTGTENITVGHSDTLDIAVSISGNGYVKVIGGAVVDGTGSITFNDGTTYEHAINGGSLPTATWNTGSTCLITGVVADRPTNTNQDFHHFTWNCPSQTGNEEVRWSGNTIGGDVTCVNSGGSQFRFTSSSEYTDSITILGDVIVLDGTLTSTGSSTALTYLIIVHGDINVTGGTFRLTAASGATVNWRLLGDLNVTNAELRSSGTTSKFIFVGTAVDTQDVAFSNMTYNGTWDYEIGPTALVRIVDGPDSIDVQVEQNFINGGDIISDGLVQFQNGSNYQHIVNSGTIPVGVWETGSTATFTGITSQAPANRNQSYYNIIWDCPGQLSNLNMGFDEVTIGGDVTIVSTGASNRWYLCSPPGGDSATVTINGNIIQTGGQFSSNGSGNAAFIEITVNGDIIVTGGNFAASRGSQGGTGTSKWYLYGANFSMTDATTQNSNAAGAKFIFSGTTQQNLTLTNVTFSGGFPVEVAPNAILDVGTSQIEGSGIFTLNDAATLQTANVALDSTLQNTGVITLGTAANYTYNGTSAQVTGGLLPTTVNSLTVDNVLGLTLTSSLLANGTVSLSSGDLLLNGNTLTLGPTAMLSETAGNTVTGTSGKISVTRTLNAPSGDNVGGLGAMLTSAVNLGSTLIERINTSGAGNGNTGINRQFNIVPTNNSGLNATFRLYYDESELNSISEANLTMFKSPDGTNNTWNGVGGTVNTADNYVELSGIGDFSYWTLADVNVPIPVELTSFTAVASKDEVFLNWATATETNNSGWNIERKQIAEEQPQSWQIIGFVDGSGTTTSTKDYSFTDNNISSGKYQYRLQQVDYDGTLNYSDAVEVDVTLLPDEFMLYQNYPNPFNPATIIKFDVPSSSFVNISIYNTIGERVATLINKQMEAGVHFARFDASNQPSGIYIYRLTADNNVFTNKMMLIK